MPFAPQTLGNAPWSDFRVKTAGMAPFHFIPSRPFGYDNDQVTSDIISVFVSDNWFVANWRLECHIGFCKCLPELACGLSCVALAWHWASGSTPYGVTAGYCISLLHRWHNWNSCQKPPPTSFPRPLVLMLWLPTPCPSQRSLHRAPIFRLLLKVAFAKMSAPNFISIASTWSLRETILKRCSARCPCVCVWHENTPYLGVAVTLFKTVAVLVAGQQKAYKGVSGTTF